MMAAATYTTIATRLIGLKVQTGGEPDEIDFEIGFLAAQPGFASVLTRVSLIRLARVYRVCPEGRRPSS